jgi:hypothetical protein
VSQQTAIVFLGYIKEFYQLQNIGIETHVFLLDGLSHLLDQVRAPSKGRVYIKPVGNDTFFAGDSQL